MDVGRLLNMVVNMVVRRAIGGAMNAGLRRLGGASKPRSTMTDAERAGADQAAASQKRMKDLAKITRRFWR